MKIENIKKEHGEVIVEIAIGLVIKLGIDTILSYGKEKLVEMSTPPGVDNPIIADYFAQGVAKAAYEIAECGDNEITAYVAMNFADRAKGDYIPKNRLYEVLKSAIDAELATRQTSDVLDDLISIGLTQAEICYLGYEDVFFPD